MNKINGIALICLVFTMNVLATASKSTQDVSNTAFEQTPGQLQQTISKAITAFEQTSRKDWSYRISRYENEEGDISSSVEHFDPTHERLKQWSLLSINGQAPTKKQALKFVNSKLKKAKEQDQPSFQLKLRDLVLMESLQLISENEETLQASFNVYLEDLGAEASKNLQGTLRFVKDQQFIESIEITNTDDFSPMFSATITHIKLTFRFIKRHTAILPQQIGLAMNGTFAFFTEIDEVSTDTFSDYRYVLNAP